MARECKVENHLSSSVEKSICLFIISFTRFLLLVASTRVIHPMSSYLYLFFVLAFLRSPAFFGPKGGMAGCQRKLGVDNNGIL